MGPSTNCSKENPEHTLTDHFQLGYQLSTAMIWMMMVLAVLIIFSNLLVVGTVIYDRCLQKLRYAPLVSLCVADFLMGLVPITFLLPSDIDQTGLRPVFTFTAFVHMGSILNLVVVCIERWIAIFKPLRYGAFLKKRNIVGLIGVAWLSAAVISLPTLAFEDSQIYDKAFSELKFERKYILVLCGTFFVVCFAVGFMQFQIILLVKKHINRAGPVFEISVNEASTSSAAASSISNNLGVTSRKDFKRREIATAIAINLMYLAVVFTWTPCVIITILIFSGRFVASCKEGMQYAVFLVFLNCLINPIIYAFRIKDFKLAILRLLSSLPGFKLCLGSRRVGDSSSIDVVVSRIKKPSIVSSPENLNLN